MNPEVATSQQEQVHTNSKKRPAVSASPSSSPNNKRRLRDISWRVCRTVQQQGRTTFARVADTFEDSFRRRVYDCLNVLLGTGLMVRDAHHILWRGYHVARDQRPLLRRRVQDSLTQLQCWRRLVELNATKPHSTIVPHKTLPLPFVVVQTDPSTVVQCRMSESLDTVAFDLTRPFVLHDDMAVMQAMGLHKTDVMTLETWLPRDFVVYCYQHGLLDHMVEK